MKNFCTSQNLYLPSGVQPRLSSVAQPHNALSVTKNFSTRQRQRKTRSQASQVPARMMFGSFDLERSIRTQKQNLPDQTL